MSFRHKITQLRASLTGVSYETPKGDWLGAPILEGTQVGDGSDAQLEWEPPETDMTIMGYELFVDGVFYKRVGKVTEYLYEDMDFEVQYDFKVRALGPVGTPSPFSNTVTIEGGGKPDLFISAVSEKEGLSVEWNDVSDNSFYSIEGYNVYVEVGDYSDQSEFGSPINSSPLDTLFTKYTKLGLAPDTTYSVGVSYIYDGGQESDIYFLSLTLSPPTYYYSIESANDPPVAIVSGESGNAAIKVKNGTKVSIYSMTPPEAFHYYKAWVSIYFNGTWKTYFELRGNGKTPTTFINSEGCYAEAFTLDKIGDRQFIGNIQDDTILKGGWSRSFYWTVSGGCPDNKRNLWQSWIMFVEDSDETVLEDNIEAYNNNSRIAFEMHKIPIDEPLLKVHDITNQNVTLRLYQYVGLPFANLYIKLQSESSYGDPYNSDPIGEWPGGGYVVRDLEPGDYDAEVEYLYMDGVTAHPMKTNEVQFTIL